MPVCVTKRASGGGGVPYVPPASRVDHKGSWDPTTNTPTLADGAGDVGDEYKISASGTRDLGNGDIEFVQGSYIRYDGVNWTTTPKGGVSYDVIGQLTYTVPPSETVLNGYLVDDGTNTGTTYISSTADPSTPVAGAVAVSASPLDVGSTVGNKAGLLTQVAGLRKGFRTLVSTSGMLYIYDGVDQTQASSWNPIFTTYTLSSAASITLRNQPATELTEGHVIREYNTGNAYAFYTDTGATPPDTDPAWHEISNGGGTAVGLVTATANGLKRLTGWVAAPMTSTTLNLNDNDSFVLPNDAVVVNIAFPTEDDKAPGDGREVKIFVNSTAQVRSTGNCVLDENATSVNKPTGSGIIELKYKYDDDLWYEVSRKEY